MIAFILLFLIAVLLLLNLEIISDSPMEWNVYEADLWPVSTKPTNGEGNTSMFVRVHCNR